MKKVLPILIVLSLLISLAPTALASNVSVYEASEALETLGLLKGSDKGLELERTPTRGEALVMLLRLTGQEKSAETYKGTSIFTDVTGTWLSPYVAYAYNNGITKGISQNSFGGNNRASVRDYLTFVLRALGYTEGSDFTWSNSIAFSDSIGLTHGEYDASSPFTREDMVLVSYTALTLKLKGSDKTLVENLYSAGVISYSALTTTRLSGYVNTDKKVYTASEIYQRSSSAVFKLYLYENKEDYDNDIHSATASGFFVTSDGVSVMSYHAIDGMKYAVAETNDGHRYNLTGILYYDTLRDIAVARISKTDTDGKTVTRFPYIDIGDSDTASVGSDIYVLGSPNGLSDTFTSGIVSTTSRVVDDENYPCIQITAPISTGSSGGPLLNEYGEAIGVVYAMYASGNSLYLCVPINSIKNVSFTGTGESLSTICSRLDALKERSTITASTENITLKVGEKATILVSSDCPVAFSAKYTLTNFETVSCSWGNFKSRTSVELEITALAAGECDITLGFGDSCGTEDYGVPVHVTVVE
jgi:S1-C subfamily serine protease